MNSVPTDRAAVLEAWGWRDPVAAVAQSLCTELQRELPPGHLLYGRAVETVAYREDQDDVLFRHRDQKDRFTVIHLTWTRKREINAEHPSVCFDGTLAEFLREQ